MKIYLKLIVILATVWVATACVSPRVVEDLKKSKSETDTQNAQLKKDNDELKTINTEMKARLDKLEKDVMILERDTSLQGTSLRRMIKNYDKLNEQYNEMLRNTEKMLAGSETETRRALRELQIAQEQLQERENKVKKMEDEVNSLEKNLKITEKELESERLRLDDLKEKLVEREKKVNELSQILKDKEEAVTRLKNTVSQALRGFEGSGLTVVEKNGKVYVSMDERLLFASGSTTVDSRGRQAIIELGKALEKEADINVMIEGHTDNVPLSGSGAIRDNWDLSVLRATSIVKILLENRNISPSRIIAAGRGEFQPIAPNDTRENKARNRRTEIILTPKLNELFQILEN